MRVFNLMAMFKCFAEHVEHPQRNRLSVWKHPSLSIQHGIKSSLLISGPQHCNLSWHIFPVHVGRVELRGHPK